MHCEAATGFISWTSHRKQTGTQDMQTESRLRNCRGRMGPALANLPSSPRFALASPVLTHHMPTTIQTFPEVKTINNGFVSVLLVDKTTADECSSSLYLSHN